MGVAADLTNPPFTFQAGPQLLGFFFNWGLFGVLCVQVYMYYISFPTDPKWRKSLVYIVLALDTVQLAMVTNDAFQHFVYAWGTPDAFNSFGVGWFSVAFLSGIISCTVQIFFASRIWILSNSRFFPGAIVLLALCQGSAAMALGIKIKALPVSEQSETTPIALVWFIGSAVVDILIAGTMTTILLRSKGDISATNLLIDKLIRLTIESGSATAVVAVIAVILFLISPKSLLYQCPVFMITKMYSNTLLAVLNNRAFIRGMNTTLGTEHSSHWNARRHGRSSGDATRQNHELDLGRAVRIEVFDETVVRGDSDDMPMDTMNKGDVKLSVSRANFPDAGFIHSV